MAQHMIRVNEQGRIIKAYSTDFEASVSGDICVAEDGDRHFNLELIDGVTGEYRLAWDDVNLEIVLVDLTAPLAVKNKEAQILVKYNEMSTDVLAQMALTFGTTKPESASAYHDTWVLMAAEPALFSAEGLKADLAIGGFLVGDALDTNQKVQDYANACIAAAKTYAVYRMNRIKQFKVDKAVILAS